MAPLSYSFAMGASHSAQDSRNLVTVDLRGMKATLVERARSQRVSVSALVRAAVERALGRVEPSPQQVEGAPPGKGDSIVRLSLRLTRDEVARLDAGAQQACLSRAAFVAGLLQGMSSLGSASHPEYLATLTASSSELSTLSRNLHHLTALLRHGEVQAAREYRAMLDTLGEDVRRHLHLAAGVLAELRLMSPSRRTGARPSERS